MSRFIITKEKIKLLIAINITLILRVLCRFFVTKDYWIICERGYDARDNAYFFYKYMKREHPEQKVYYVIDSKSSDYHKVKDDAIEYKSIKTLIKVFLSSKIISTHYGKIVFGLSQKYFRLSGLQNKFYFLQHGIIGNFLSGLHYNNAPMNAFFCGAYPEYNYVKNTFNHPDGVVKYTGLARFDNLHNSNIKRQILVMPTWRSWCNIDFEKSQYFKCWMGFLNDKKLLKALDEHNVKLVFYPHFELQKHIHLFKSESENVFIASFADYDVQSLLKESALLITDYSSVHFDFAYMKKPTIYYQFDSERFFSEHYGRGFFDYKTMGFGKVCDEHGEFVDEVVSFMNESFVLETEYAERIEDFFPLHDTKNCERIYNVIINE